MYSKPNLVEKNMYLKTSTFARYKVHTLWCLWLEQMSTYTSCLI